MSHKYIMYDPVDFCKAEITYANDADEITRLRTENEMLREALLFYVDENNWKMNSPLDMNSGNFTGGPARAAIEGVTKKEGAGHE